MNKVDLFVANYNTLPWLRLFYQQFLALRPKTNTRLFVWDNDSRDGSKEWLAASGIEHHLHPFVLLHSPTLAEFLKRATAPLVCFMDVDAIPYADGWLGDAVAHLDHDPKIGAVGLVCGSRHGNHRPFVHPAFSLFRLETIRRLDLSFYEEKSKTDFFDVGELASKKVEDSGLELKIVGGSKFHPDNTARWNQKVAHFYGSTAVLSPDRKFTDERVRGIIEEHRRGLQHLGLFDSFMGFLRETKNPLVARYS